MFCQLIYNLFNKIEKLQKVLIISLIVGICVAGTVTVAKLEEKKPEIVEDLKTAETNGRQFSHGGKFFLQFQLFLEDGFDCPYF